jgi:hypothetical protein
MPQASTQIPEADLVPYTDRIHMNCRIYLVILIFLLMVPSTQAARPTYQNGIVTRVEKKAHERTLYYLVNTPMLAEDPYCEISVRVNDQVYIGEYPLRSTDDELPFDWKQGDKVRVFIDKAHMVLQSPGSETLKMVIGRHFSVQSEKDKNSR